ncbi:MAG: hypothetical protein Q8P81_03260 [Nanoarchaeota archaeon]|nr:hypothetical protein [Nanoarchaeota archaeon]
MKIQIEDMSGNKTEEEMKREEELSRPHYVECQCFSPEHVTRFMFNVEDGEIYMETFLDFYKGFFGRLWDGIKHIFGHRSMYGHFDGAVLSMEEAIDLRDKLDTFIDVVLLEEINKEKML